MPNIPTLTDVAPQQDMFSGAQLRDAGLNLVLENAGKDWQQDTLGKLRAYASMMAGHTFTAQDFRAWHTELGGRNPHHPNAWGAIWRMGLQAGMLVRTGRTTQSTSKQAHCRAVAIYVGRRT